MSGSDFWSRRRAAVAEEASAEQAVLDAEHAAQAEAELAEQDDETLLASLELSPPEELKSAEQVRHFLTHALPQRLKTRALRRLWRLNPTLANLDGLLEYGEDYTDSATVIENLQTAYQVGKGMLAHLEQLAAEAEADETEEDQVEDAPTLVEDEPEPPLAETEVAVAAAPLPPEPQDDFVPAPRARRMTFTFQEQRTG